MRGVHYIVLALWASLTTTCIGQGTGAKHDHLGHPSSRKNNVYDCSPQVYPKEGGAPVPSPLMLSNPVDDFLWVLNSTTKQETVVFITTYTKTGYPGGPLWKGSGLEEGTVKWTEMADELKMAISTSGAQGPQEDVDLGVVGVHASPVDSNVLFFQGHGKWHWVSEDGGKTVKAVLTPASTEGRKEIVKFHPKQSKWILLRTTRDACDVSLKSSGCLFDLVVSKDLGNTWINLTERSQGQLGGVRDFDWGMKISRFNGRETQEEDIFVTAYPGTAAKKGMPPGWDDSLQFFFSDDLFKSAAKRTIQCGNLFEIISDRMFMAIPSNCPVDPSGKPRKAGSGAIKDRSVTMFVSVHGHEFVEACLPANIEDDGYSLIYTHDKEGVFVLADHADPGSKGPTEDSPSADAYAPAYNASLHTLSLDMVYRRGFISDFARIEGIPGFYVANQVEGTSSSTFFSYLKTKHTMNGGSSWELISPPQSFRHSQCNTCTPGSSLEDCSLHLHGPTSWLAPEGPHPHFYSVQSAPGVMLATGNVGSQLNFHPDADCTYMSRDGGKSWFDIADNTAIYEMSSSGGTVVMAAHRSEGPTNEIAFSLDQGSCFHTVKLSQSMLVENIRVASDCESNIFYVTGSACIKSALHPDCTFDGGSNAQGMLYVIDLPKLLGDDWKECDTSDRSSDYEKWDFNGKCILGTQRNLLRRSSESFCANPKCKRPKIEVKEACKCTVKDVECEFGYKRATNDTCIAMQDVDIESACPRLLESSYKTSTSHFRLVHDNMCSQINNVIPDTNGKGGPKGSSDPGDDSSTTGSGGSFIRSFSVFVIVAGTISVGLGIVWSQLLSEEQQQSILQILDPVVTGLAAGFEMCLGMVVEAYDWVRAKLNRLPFVSDQTDQDARGYYEALSGSRTGLDVDPEDQNSPNAL